MSTQTSTAAGPMTFTDDPSLPLSNLPTSAEPEPVTNRAPRSSETISAGQATDALAIEAVVESPALLTETSPMGQSLVAPVAVVLPPADEAPGKAEGVSLSPWIETPSSGNGPAGKAVGSPMPKQDTPFLLDPTLLAAAQMVDDLEKTANANANRLRMLTRSTADKDGFIRGVGLTEDHPQVAVMTGLVQSLKDAEKVAVKSLERAMKEHPLGAWIDATPGIGLKQGARLLAAVGDPYWRFDILDEHGNVVTPAGPRTVAQLWAYCGKHVVDGKAAKRRRGVRCNWSVTASARAFVVAESCIKQIGGVRKNGTRMPLSPYRAVYDKRRARTELTHPEWDDGKRHYDALRITAKAILKDMWIESRRLYVEAGLAPNVSLEETP